ncbi:pentapeptide repeat-containing protein [Actinokineospora auranticolor]|nr:pentapeptide repeat-containing protein [Actinokineospora auranticolor]
MLATVLVSVGLFAVVSSWLLSEPNANRGEALKTAGLAGGAVVAMYALWLNDRRRRVEERRHELESQRTEFDRERVADERFAKAVELLGNSADQVRVGALHVLAGLARSRPAYTQTVVDVFCSYLRQPFPRDPDGTPTDPGEGQVRKTAQRLIAGLLPPADHPGPHLDLDLTGADLEYFDITGRAVGEILLRRAQLHQSNALKGCVFHEDSYFTAMVNHGMLHLNDTTFHGRAWFAGFTAHGPVRFHRGRFLGLTKFDGARFHDVLELRD